MRTKVLFILSQPTQSIEPFEILSKSGGLDLNLAYLSGVDEKLWKGEEFINKKSLNLEIPGNIKTVQLKNYSPSPSLKSFFGLMHPGLIKLVWEYDCVVVYGHAYFSLWLAIIAAKVCGKRLLLSNDAIELLPKDSIKSRIKKLLYPFLYNILSNGVLVPSSKARDFQISLGVKAEKIFLTPYVVDNLKISDLSRKYDKDTSRNLLGLPLNKKIILFVGKLIDRKNPLDLLLAFHSANIKDSYLVYIGNGPLSGRLKSEILSLGLSDCVKCLGELAYDKLVMAYVASDVLVHPAEIEPWGLIVNEAMICGVPVIASDKVGAAADLITNRENGFTYSAGNISELTDILKIVLTDGQKCKELGFKAAERMNTWSPRENAQAHLNAINKLMGL